MTWRQRVPKFVGFDILETCSQQGLAVARPNPSIRRASIFSLWKATPCDRSPVALAGTQHCCIALYGNGNIRLGVGLAINTTAQLRSLGGILVDASQSVQLAGNSIGDSLIREHIGPLVGIRGRFVARAQYRGTHRRCF